MSRFLIIPDIHGSHHWEKVKAIPTTDYDYAIFLGDYFDSWENEWPDQGENFINICNWVREDTEHRKMVFGNHDWSYVSETRFGSGVSGHQHNKIAEIRRLIKSNLDILDIALDIDGYVFSHAGFTKTWVNDYLKPELHNMLDKWPEEDDGNGLVWDESEYSVKFLNEQFHKLSLSSGDENFNYAFEELLDWHGHFSGSGDEKCQGPLWVRPSALLSDSYYENQVVGHTEYGIGGPAYLSENKCNLIIMDSVSHSNVMILDTTNLPKSKSIVEFNRDTKRIQKIIKDNKSIGMQKEDVVAYLVNHSGMSEVSATDWVNLYIWTEQTD